MAKRRRLIGQLYPSYLLLVFIVLGAAGWFAGHSMRSFYVSQTRQDLMHQASLLTGQFRPLLNPADPAALDRLCKASGARVPTRITVILPDGRVVGDSEATPLTMENHGERPEIKQALKGETGSAIRFSGTLQQRMLYVAVPIFEKDHIQGVMRIAIATRAVDKQLHALQARIALGGVVIAMVAAILSLVISRRISRPLETMRRGAARFARGDLSHRLYPPATLELAELAEAMNQMAQDLQGRMDALVRQRNETQAVLAGMVECVVAIDRNERIMNINPAAARLVNQSAEQLKGRSLQEVMRSRELYDMIRTTLTEGTHTEKDIALYQNGEQILSTHCSLLKDARSETIGVLLVMNDVTQMRHLENMRQDFVANVSHEIKTPLTAIQGFVETLHDGGVEDPGEAQRFLDIIQRHVLRLTAIIDDLLQLSNLEQAPEIQQLNLTRNNVNRMIGTAVQLCHTQAKEKQIHIHTQCPENLTAMMDTDLMEQAVMNLLDNAIKYSPDKSRIHISVTLVDAAIQIIIQDEGLGIAQKHLPRLFERFYRVDKARSRKMGGTGLGLAIVKHIMQTHGGQVSVESTQGQGSTFILHLPKH